MRKILVLFLLKLNVMTLHMVSNKPIYYYFDEGSSGNKCNSGSVTTKGSALVLVGVKVQLAMHQLPSQYTTLSIINLTNINARLIEIALEGESAYMQTGIRELNDQFIY
jgi:hypothetical protein